MGKFQKNKAIEFQGNMMEIFEMAKIQEIYDLLIINALQIVIEILYEHKVLMKIKIEQTQKNEKIIFIEIKTINE